MVEEKAKEKPMAVAVVGVVAKPLVVHSTEG